MRGAQPQFSLERDVVEVLDLLVSMLGDVPVTQRNLVDVVSELQQAMHEPPQPEMDASSTADARNTCDGLRGQAHQSQLHAGRLVQHAKELCARAERLDVEAAQLVGAAAGVARPTLSMPPPSTPGSAPERRRETRRARETDRR